MSTKVTNEQITSSSHSHACGGPLNHSLASKSWQCSLLLHFFLLSTRNQWQKAMVCGANRQCSMSSMQSRAGSRRAVWCHQEGTRGGTDTRRDNTAKGHPRLSHYPPISVKRQWPPTTGNIRCACEWSLLMVIVLLRDTGTAMINDMSVLSLPLRYRKNTPQWIPRLMDP